MYPRLSQTDKIRMKEELRVEIGKLLQQLKTVDCNKKLIYEEENVVKQVERIEEFFDKVCNNLSEIRDYMITLNEHMMND